VPHHLTVPYPESGNAGPWFRPILISARDVAEMPPRFILRGRQKHLGAFN
jgi:hypothetical protein